MKITIKNLKKGDKAKIVEINSYSASIRRLMEMGLTVGTVIEVERIAPLGDPIDIKVKGYHLSVRKHEAEGIYVEII